LLGALLCVPWGEVHAEDRVETPADPSASPPGVWYEGHFYGFRGGAAEAAGVVGAAVSEADGLDWGEAADGWVEIPVASSPRFYVSAEALLGWSSGAATPVLASSSAIVPPVAAAGVLGQASTTALMGGNETLADMQPGGRFVAGAWLDESLHSSLEASCLLLGENRARFAGGSAEYAVLARPFFNASTGIEDARLIAYPGLVEGTLAIQSRSELQIASIAYRRVADFTPWVQADLLAGYRFARLSEGVAIAETTLGLSGPDAGVTRVTSERVATRNAFHGGEIGLVLNHPLGPGWVLDGSARAAVGAVQRRGRVSGSTSTSAGGASASRAGGLLTQSTNLGDYRSDDFGALSEFGVTLHRQIAPRVRLIAGYDLVLWSSVWRAAEQIDRQVNPTQIPPGTLAGPSRPRYPATESLVWVQGLRFGLEAKY
jgi:hypothetical protein